MFTYELNFDEADKVLRDVERALVNDSELMGEIGEILTESTKERFKAGVSPDGVTWAPKSDATIKKYERSGDRVSFRPLIGPTGRLSSEIHYQASSGSVQWGSNLIQAAVMQMGAEKGEFGTASNGSPTPWGDIPARPFIGLSNTDQTLMKEAIEDWLEEASNRPG